MPKVKKSDAPPMSYAEVRRFRDLSQSEFWGNIGVTQSAGSRYEAYRTIPDPTKKLADLVYTMSEKDAIAALLKLRAIRASK